LRALKLNSGNLGLDSEFTPISMGDSEVLIRPLLLGVCRTDLELIKGYYPYQGVLGHEFVGEVVDGPVKWLGQRVVGEINAVCGHCLRCQKGEERHCQNRSVLGILGRDGCFADRFYLPEENLHAVPDSVPDESAVFVEPLAAAFRVIEQCPPLKDQRWLVVGDGRLGQLVARVVQSALSQSDRFESVTVLGRHERKLKLLSSLGLDVTTDAEELLSPNLRGEGFDVAVDCTGNDLGFDLARRALKPLGTLIMKSTYTGDLSCNASALVVDEIRLLGSRCGPFEPALEALASGAVDPRDLVDLEMNLDRSVEALDKAGERGVMKVLIRP